MADRDYLPGMSREPRRARPRRHAGPWRVPARNPCGFTQINRVVCGLESVRVWWRDAHGEIGSAKVQAVNTVQAVAAGMLFRCALHPLDKDRR